MGWLMVGPESARLLGDLGAEVIKVESGGRVDPLRTLGPFKDGVSGLERSLSHHAINAGKRSLALDLKHTHAKQIIERLVSWADVLIESFAPGVIDRLGCSYETLREINPGLIMLSTSILGSRGPHSQGTNGIGTTGSAYCGATHLLGWPDRPPSGPYGPWTDSVAPRFVVPGLLAALHRRRRTGEGCYLDAAQAECGLQFLLPAFYDCAVNGRVPQRRGEAGSTLRCPSGVFRCAGDDRWVVIDASKDEHWCNLRWVIGNELNDHRFDTLLGRLRGRDEIHTAIEAWTLSRSAQEAESVLQVAGIPAHVVSTAQDIANDSDLQHLGYHRTVQIPGGGEVVLRGPNFRMEHTPPPPALPAPSLGGSSREILRSVCNFSEEEIDGFEETGALR